MKRAMILCLFWAMSLNAGECATNWFPPLQPIGGNNNNGVTSVADPDAKSPYLADANANYPKINQIERSLYGQNYIKQDILKRLARIEKSLFSTSYPSLALSQRVDNIIMNFNQMNEMPNLTSNTLSDIEAKVLKKCYVKNKVESRIERLEQKIFGATQSGDLSARLETLKAAAQNYSQEQDMTAYNQNPFPDTQIRRRGLLGTLSNMLNGGGTMTGFTPMIDPFSNYNNTFSNNGYNNFSTMGPQNLYSTMGNQNGYNNFSNMRNPNGYFSNMGSPSGNNNYSGTPTSRRYYNGSSSSNSGCRVTILD